MKWLWEDPVGVLILTLVVLALVLTAGRLAQLMLFSHRARRFRRIVIERYGLDSDPVVTKRPEENRGNQDAR